jgi:dsDNA-specific endonuclease/ATPase MutS2
VADDEPVAEVAVGDALDLHTFRPAECADVVEEYVRAAHEAGLAAVRIIHGKGTGSLRRTVHAVLDRHPAVASYELAEQGNWGATIVQLRSRPT